MNPFDQARSKQQTGTTVTSPKPVIKQPHSELTAEMQYAYHVQASADVSTDSGLLYHWDGNCWKVLEDKTSQKMVLMWLGKHMSKRATVATADSCLKAALLMANELPPKPDDLIIPLYGMWLHIDQQGQIRAERPNRSIGVKHAVPIVANMGVGDYTPAPLPEDSMFAKFLQSSLPDPAVRKLLQTYIGYTLTGHTEHQVAQLWIGQKGGNGKSTMLKIAMALHEKPVAAQLDKLEGFTLTNLLGTTLVACDETPKGKINQQVLKSLISGGSVNVDRKYKDAVSYTNTAKFIICANHMPALTDHSDAFWRRFHVIAWNETFKDGKTIPNLDQKIIKNELHLVLDWALLGLQQLQNDGEFIIPQAVDDAIYQAKVASNSVASWMDDNGITYSAPEQLYMAKSELFNDYVEYCRQHRLSPCSLQQLFTRLHALFPAIDEKRPGSGKVRPRCVNLTIGVFSPEDLSKQVQHELDEISQAFGYDTNKE